MTNEIKKIVLTFENCEYLEIPIDKVKCLSVEGVKTSYNKSWCNKSIQRTNVPEKVFICLDYGNKEDYKRVMQYQDITYVEFVGDHHSEVFDIHWGDDTFFNDNNENQFYRVVENEFYIYIGHDIDFKEEESEDD